MIKQILTILDDYKSEIHLVEESNLSEPNNSSKGIKISRRYIQKLRVLVRENDFNSIKDEIDFFKIHKPYVYGRLKFFVKIHRYALEKPNGHTKRLRKHIEEQLINIEERRKSYLDFEKYYLQNQTTLDKYYFVRGKDSLELISEIDNAKFDYSMFADGSGDITNFNIKITIPIQFYNSLSNQNFTEDLIAYIEVGENTTIDGLYHELNSLSLKTSFGSFKVEKKLEWMEDALIALQNQLPENMYLKTCLSCKYSNYSPYGNGMFGNIYCFKNLKEELKQVRQKHDLLHIWTAEAVNKGDIFSVQETFDCSEHKLPTADDWYYKSWTKLISKNDEIKHIESTLFYKKINALLREQFSEIKQIILPQYTQLLEDRQFNNPLPIISKFEYAIWGGNQQWRLELDFDEYQWSNETIKPHFLNAFISFDTTKECIHFKYQLCSSFNETLLPMEQQKIETKLLNDANFVSKKIEEVKQFLADVPQRFMEEIRKIDFEELEYVEDIKEIYEIINVHKVNDTKEFYTRTQLFLLDAIELMNEHIHDYEKIILEYTRKMYTEEIPHCQNKLKSFWIIVAKKRINEINSSDERVHLLNAINGFLTPFEAYNGNDEDKRSYELDYKIDDLLQAGLKRKHFIPLVKKHFAEIFDDE